MKKYRTALSLMLFACTIAGCAEFGFPGAGDGMPQAPIVSVSAIRVAELPSAKKVANYLCSEKFGAMPCTLLGPRANLADLAVAFDIELEFRNPNPIPLPLVHALFAFDAFPGQATNNKLGTLCMTFCEDPRSCTQNANACRSDQPEIKDAKDFADATKDFLISMARGESALSDLRVRTIAPGDRLAMVVRLGLAPLQVANLLRTEAHAELDRLKTGKVPEFSIPYSLEGTAWVDVAKFGKLAAPFGPAQGEFKLAKN